MPHYTQGDMWSAWDSADLFVITTNSTLRAASTLRLSDRALVMGRGIALQTRNRFPGIAQALGRAIDAQCGSGGVYGLLVSPAWPAAKLGAFQVKRDWRDAADLNLIRRSTAMLLAWCRAHPDRQVHLNFPGVGNGRRNRAEVQPIIDVLPEAVTIWEYAQAKVDAPTPPQSRPPAGNGGRPRTPCATRAQLFTFDAWDEEAAAEAYAQFVAGEPLHAGAVASAETGDASVAIFAAGFKRGCAWRQARIQASHHPAPAAGVAIGREQGNGLAGQ